MIKLTTAMTTEDVENTVFGNIGCYKTTRFDINGNTITVTGECREVIVDGDVVDYETVYTAYSDTDETEGNAVEVLSFIESAIYNAYEEECINAYADMLNNAYVNEASVLHHFC